MKIYHREAAIRRIDELAAAGCTFIFAISYDTETAVVEEAAAVNSCECLFAFPGLNNIPANAAIDAHSVMWKAYVPTQQTYARQLQIGDQYFAARHFSSSPRSVSILAQKSPCLFFARNVRTRRWPYYQFVPDERNH